MDWWVRDAQFAHRLQKFWLQYELRSGRPRSSSEELRFSIHPRVLVFNFAEKRQGKKVLTSLGLAALMVIGGAGVASAWQFVPKSEPQQAIYDKVIRGDGWGTMNRRGYNYVDTKVELRDRYFKNEWKVFQASSTSNGATCQTKRTSSKAWVKMDTVSLYSYQGFVGVIGYSKVCEDAPLRPDICSKTRNSRL